MNIISLLNVYGQRVIYLPVFFSLLVYLQAHQSDTLERAKRAAESAELTIARGEKFRIAIQNADISRFPVIKLIVEVTEGSPFILDTINPASLVVRENGIDKGVIGIEKLSIEQNVRVDFVFIIDVTGTMQGYIDDIKRNVESFTRSLQSRGIDYRLGLISFTDVVETLNQPTSDVREFLRWLSLLKAAGGGDEKENALEALAELKKIRFRSAASRVAVIVSDAPFHQAGEKGSGATSFTTNSMIAFLQSLEVKTFCIVKPDLIEYNRLAKGTRGSVYNIAHPFSRILDSYSTQITNQYAVSYRSDTRLKSDSINVAILDEQRQELVRQIIPIVEIGRKFIIENLLFATNSAVLPDSVEELDVLLDFLGSRPGVRVRVEGYTDSRGSLAHNMNLSNERAMSVRNYLISKGLDAARIEVSGLGPANPIASNKTDFGRRLNRRTEVIIIDK